MNTLREWFDSVNNDQWTRLVVSLLLCLLAVRALRAVINRQIDEPDMRYRAGRVVKSLGWVVALLLVVGSFSGSFSGILTSLSVIGAGIAFALQEVIASVAGRLAVLTGRFYRVGDRVELGGIKGDVIDIGVLRTTVMEIGDWVRGDLYTGRVVRVANSFVFKAPVFNYSGDFGFLWDEIALPVTYGVDHVRMRETLQRVLADVVGEFVDPASREWHEMLAKYRVENAQIAPMVTLVLTDNWMEFTARYVVPFDRRRSTKDRLFMRILDEIAKSEGALRLASATSAIVSMPSMDVRLVVDRPERGV